MKKVAILLVVTNEEKYLPLLLNSIKEQTYTNIDVYILDNNSTDQSVKLAKELYPDVILTLKNKNIGFSKGINILAEKAFNEGANYIFIFNPDMEIHPKCISELINLAESDENIGIVAPIRFWGDPNKKRNKIQSYGININFEKRKTHRPDYIGKYIEDLKIPTKREVDVAGGGNSFIKFTVYKEIGLFDEKLFMYGEEIDFYYRVKKAGYKSMVTQDAIIWHYHDYSKSNKISKYRMYYYSTRNKYLYFRKYNFKKTFFLELCKDIILFPVKIKWAIQSADIKLLFYYYIGVFDGIRNKSGKSNLFS